MPEIRLDLLSSRLNVLVIPQVDNVCVDTMIMAHGQAMDICLFAFYVLTVASEDPKVIGILTLLFGMGFKVQEIKKKLKGKFPCFPLRYIHEEDKLTLGNRVPQPSSSLRIGFGPSPSELATGLTLPRTATTLTMALVSWYVSRAAIGTSTT